MKIYTKTGDDGTSSLYNGERRIKEDPVFSALGDVDELNSAIGIARQFLHEGKHGGIVEELETIQSRLLDLGSFIATPATNSTDLQLRRVEFSGEHHAMLEQWIDAHAAQLPVLTKFILPSGGLASSHLHMARSICRRAERSYVAVLTSCSEEGRMASNHASKYLNRLSDYLFTAARVAAQADGVEEVVYKKV